MPKATFFELGVYNVCYLLSELAVHKNNLKRTSVCSEISIDSTLIKVVGK